MLDKRKANVWVKLVALVIAVAFVAYYALILISGGSTGGSAKSTATTKTGTTAEEQQYLDLIAQHQQLLASSPTSTSLLVQLGNDYFDLANAEANAKKTVMAEGNFRLAAEEYGRYLKLKPKDANARTDRAIALFYAGNVQGAIAEAQTVLKADPSHDKAMFNLGIFYADGAGDSAKAREIWQRYLKLYPAGPGADFVKKRLANLK